MGCIPACWFSVTYSCLTVCDPTDCSLPGSSVHGIIQARILERLPFPTSGYISKEKDIIISKRYIYSPIHDSIIHTSQGMDTPKYPSTVERIKKMWYICDGILFSLKKKEALEALWQMK